MISSPQGQASRQNLFALLLTVTVILALYFAQDVLIPLALGILLTFLLAPIVHRIENYLPRIAAVIITVSLALALVGGVTWVVTNQFIDLVNKLPDYKENMRKKIWSLRAPKDSAFTRATETFRELSQEIEGTQATTATTAATTETITTQSQPVQSPIVENTVVTSASQALHGAPSRGNRQNPVRSQLQSDEKPVPVEIVSSRVSYMTIFTNFISPVLGPLGTAGIVIIFVVFMLLQQDDLRDRFVRLAGKGRINVTTQAMDEAARRVSRYLLMQVIVNVTYGIPVAVGLYFIGVPNALLWGVLATVLRFIPYLGPWMAAVLPIALSLAVFDGWTKPMLTIGLFILLELISNNFVEPFLYGAHTGVSPVAILVSAVFWTWLWGGVGLFMATPLTVCLVVIGRYVPQLAFLNIMLGDEPVLPPGARFYQRLIAMDQDAVSDLAEKYLEEKSLTELYDDVLVPALSLAEQDRHRNALDIVHHTFIRSTMDELVEEFGDRVRQEREERERHLTPSTAAAESHLPQNCIVCLPARDEADEIVARMLAQLMEIDGRCAKAISIHSLASEMMDVVTQNNAKVVCISALPPLAVTHARYLVKRLRTRFPELKIIVGLWNAEGDMTRARGRIQSAGTDIIVTSFGQAVEHV